MKTKTIDGELYLDLPVKQVKVFTNKNDVTQYDLDNYDVVIVEGGNIIIC